MWRNICAWFGSFLRNLEALDVALRCVGEDTTTQVSPWFLAFAGTLNTTEDRFLRVQLTFFFGLISDIVAVVNAESLCQGSAAVRRQRALVMATRIDYDGNHQLRSFGRLLVY